MLKGTKFPWIIVKEVFVWSINHVVISDAAEKYPLTKDTSTVETEMEFG